MAFFVLKFLFYTIKHFLYVTFLFTGSPLTKNNSNQMTTIGGREIRKSSSSAYFDEMSIREIEAIEGQTVIIPCTVRNLSREKVVSVDSLAAYFPYFSLIL